MDQVKHCGRDCRFIEYMTFKYWYCDHCKAEIFPEVPQETDYAIPLMLSDIHNFVYVDDDGGINITELADTIADPIITYKTLRADIDNDNS